MPKPLVEYLNLPNFSDLQPEKIKPLLIQQLANNRATLAALLNQRQDFTWENLIQPLDDMSNDLAKLWSPIAHLYAVAETDALRDAYNACLPLLTDYHTTLMQDTNLHQAIQTLAASDTYATLHVAQRKTIDNYLRDFKLAGVDLPLAAKTQLAALQQKLSQLTTQFSEHVTDATQAWSLVVTDVDELAGLTPQTLALLHDNAKQRGMTGWLISLDYPCYSAVIKHAKRRTLRQEIYEAYVTRASDLGPNAGQFDNTPIMEDIIQTRYQLALQLGFQNFAEYSLATKMADSPQRVLSFLHDLVTKAKPFALQDMQMLTAFAKEMDGLDTLEAWDIPYYSEKLRQKEYDLSPEALRPYFPIDHVLEGMFSIVQQLFAMTVQERHDIDRWHPSVRFFEVYDATQKLRGGFYIDLYARQKKRGGAWMDEYVGRQAYNGKKQYPIAFLTCNFMRPLDGQPALLMHDDVETLFHEFGHCLHHILTLVDYPAVAGLNGVPWDAVEFPSQFLEFWCWQKASLQLIARHYQTGACLPDTLYAKMLAAKNFQAGLQMLRQLEFALVDFKLHLEATPSHQLVSAIVDAVRTEVAVGPIANFNRFQHSFSHIFAGGYAAGYYSYKWAEVLASDAFSLFEERDTFHRETGLAFLTQILEQGGVYDPMTLFTTFRGREPNIDALLRHSGLTSTLDA